jgi:DNA-binding Xre family transcriptional regulator
MMVYERLQKLMAEKGLTQSQMAARLGISRTCMHNWYWGINGISIENLRMIKGVLRCEWEDLLGR